jgi:hypothetical protein
MDGSPMEVEARDQPEVTLKFQKDCISGWTLDKAVARAVRESKSLNNDRKS